VHDVALDREDEFGDGVNQTWLVSAGDQQDEGGDGARQ